MWSIATSSTQEFRTRNGIPKAYYIVEIYHSVPEPSNWYRYFVLFCLGVFFLASLVFFVPAIKKLHRPSSFHGLVIVARGWNPICRCFFFFMAIIQILFSFSNGICRALFCVFVRQVAENSSSCLNFFFFWFCVRFLLLFMVFYFRLSSSWYLVTFACVCVDMIMHMSKIYFTVCGWTWCVVCRFTWNVTFSAVMCAGF